MDRFFPLSSTTAPASAEVAHGVTGQPPETPRSAHGRPRLTHFLPSKSTRWETQRFTFQEGCKGIQGNEDIFSDPPGTARKGVRRSQPISRVLSWAVIHLRRLSPDACSSLPGSGADHTDGSLFGLAPGGVYPATRVTTRAVRSYRTISPLPPACAGLAVCFLWHFP